MDARYRENRRGYTEFVIKARHAKLSDLKETAQVKGVQNQYLFKENIPASPRPEFRVTHLKHDTNSTALCQIASDGFRAPERKQIRTEPEDPMDLVWWSLSVGPTEVQSAESRLLQEMYPERTEEQAREQTAFLQRFTTSPAFLRSSRFGSYRFTFPIEELFRAYRKQICGGRDPILRVYETVLYKQEVMHSVVVHSHFYNNLFEKYPRLTDNQDGVCAYKDGQIIWRPEAMCGTHSFQLDRKPYQNQLAAHRLSDTNAQFYVWDNVAVAFHMDDSMDLGMDRLRECLNFCEPGHPKIAGDWAFEDYKTAKELTEAWWPDYPTPLF